RGDGASTRPGTYRRSPTDATIGGIPVDSEYIIFIIDTSGSMHNYAWSMVRKKMEEILEIYPKVKGIQVMNNGVFPTSFDFSDSLVLPSDTH
ncbi:unnamed protein product, partial [marine sediment metagenome]